ncbi:MAG TPA: hypothetical protein VHW02_15545 [Rhizomicrobium sp.]|nr:hypothetical protein [Rhizomicrobium sp.]
MEPLAPDPVVVMVTAPADCVASASDSAAQNASVEIFMTLKCIDGFSIGMRQQTSSMEQQAYQAPRSAKKRKFPVMQMKQTTSSVRFAIQISRQNFAKNSHDTYANSCRKMSPEKIAGCDCHNAIGTPQKNRLASRRTRERLPTGRPGQVQP